MINTDNSTIELQRDEAHDINKKSHKSIFFFGITVVSKTACVTILLGKCYLPTNTNIRFIISAMIWTLISKVAPTSYNAPAPCPPNLSLAYFSLIIFAVYPTPVIAPLSPNNNLMSTLLSSWTDMSASTLTIASS